MPYGDFTAEYQCSQFKMSQYSQNTTEKEIKFINHYYCCLAGILPFKPVLLLRSSSETYLLNIDTSRAHNVRDAIKKRILYICQRASILLPTTFIYLETHIYNSLCLVDGEITTHSKVQINTLCGCFMFLAIITRTFNNSVVVFDIMSGTIMH